MSTSLANGGLGWRLDAELTANMKRWAAVRLARSGLLALGLATTIGAVAWSGGAPAAEPPTYRLTISDLMTATIQPRHIKIWLAGKVEDWGYAEYEAENLRGAFGRLAEAAPKYRNIATPGMLAVFATPQLSALEAAVKAEDERAFVSAYEGLTLGCNQCHQAAGQKLVVIQTPDAGPFPDQVFVPSPH